jgi:hypothetical protein
MAVQKVATICIFASSNTSGTTVYEYRCDEAEMRGLYGELEQVANMLKEEVPHLHEEYDRVVISLEVSRGFECEQEEEFVHILPLTHGEEKKLWILLGGAARLARVPRFSS